MFDVVPAVGNSCKGPESVESWPDESMNREYVGDKRRGCHCMVKTPSHRNGQVRRQRKKSCTQCQAQNSLSCGHRGTKVRPLMRTDHSASKTGKSGGMGAGWGQRGAVGWREAQVRYCGYMIGA